MAIFVGVIRPVFTPSLLDIRDPKRLRRVHRAIRDVAMPVQFSVFEAALKPSEFAALQQCLRALIDEGEDTVCFYSLSPGCQKVHLGVVGALSNLLLV